MVLKQIICASLAAVLVSGAHSAIVVGLVPQAAFNWGAGGEPGDPYGDDNDINNVWGEIDLRNGATVEVTDSFPRTTAGSTEPGTGSLEFAANGATGTKAGVAYYPPAPDGFGPLSGITSAAYDYYRATTSAPADGVPVMRLFLFESGTNDHVATLLWSPSNDGIPIVSGEWATGDVLGGTLWNSKSNSQAPYVLPAGSAMRFEDLQADDDFGPLVVRAVEIGYGSAVSWGPDFVGAADNVRFGSDTVSVNDDFEVPAPISAVPPRTATSVPTLGEWSLIALSSLLGGLALVRVRRSRTM